VSGERYVAAMMARRSDRRARQAFVDLATEIVAPGAVILDFGAGPGIDAKAFAARGYRVYGYDTDPAMRATFERVCHDEIRRGEVTLWTDDFQTFLASTALPMARAADLVVANFAPLNVVDSPRDVFRAFAALTTPDGRVLVSVLNPRFLGDLRYRWWWRNLPALGRHGEFAVKGRQFSVYRRTPRFLASAAASYFRLDRVERGLPTPLFLRRGPLGPLARLSSRYLFLLFTKNHPTADGGQPNPVVESGP
jgi:SAM-dependent methyltransferase